MRSSKDPKNLRSGFTTGTCAAGAAKAAAIMLRDGNEIHEISVKTPKGPVMTAEVLDITRGEQFVRCAVRKDAGDDPDVTNGALVYAEVRFTDVPGCEIDGGEGIGRVTKPGLDQPIGSAAINSTPRRMIREAMEEVWQRGFSEVPGAGESVGQACGKGQKESSLEARKSSGKGIRVVISIPTGVELAAKTFNPKLGIVGGISVLGTSGIVKPMSDEAIVATIRVEINVRKAEGYTALLAAPGNYGLNFLVKTYRAPAEIVVSSSNFICDTVQLAAKADFKKLLFVGHVGKMIKVAGGIRNTHSRYGDHRMEIVSAIAEEMWDREECGHCDNAREPDIAQKNIMLEELSACVMMDEAVRILKNYELAERTFSEAAKRVKRSMESWARETGVDMRVETILFGGNGILAETDGAEELLWCILSERDRAQSTS